MRQYLTVGCDRIKLIGSETDLVPGRQTDYASFQIINRKDILCCIHLSSQIYSNNDGMREVAISRILSDIKKTEEECRTENTIIVGDFNANPFDRLCLDANKIHGIPYFDVAQKGKRTVAGEKFKMFYNPMWSFFGDRERPYGTYYYAGNSINNTFWNIYDQVIIRPVLKDRFVDTSLQIVTETQTNYLLDRHDHPNKDISDHLPIIFEIKEN